MLNEWRVETVIAKSLFVVFWNMNFLQDLIATNYITPSTTTGEAVYDRVARVIYPIQEVIRKKKDPWPSQWAWPLVYADNNVETSKAFMLLSFVVQLSASLKKKVSCGLVVQCGCKLETIIALLWLAYLQLASFPGLSCFYLLFAFPRIHGSRRAAKGLGTFIT